MCKAYRGLVKTRPEWWDWELELNPHLVRRMDDRDFTELDLRDMLKSASSVRRDVVPGRWIARGQLRRPWEIVLEPDPDAQLLVVITAYPITP